MPQSGGGESDPLPRRLTLLGHEAGLMVRSGGPAKARRESLAARLLDLKAREAAIGDRIARNAEEIRHYAGALEALGAGA